jgi:hypothetical protein
MEEASSPETMVPIYQFTPSVPKKREIFNTTVGTSYLVE